MLSFRKAFFLIAVIILSGAGGAGFCPAAETLSQEKQVPEVEAREKRGNIFNVIFGAAPEMPTQRGLLLINAYHDTNANQVKDPGEEELRNEIVCRVDGIQYRIPAFIPALKLHENYRVECDTEAASGSFSPENENTELFVQRKGQVFFVELPCQRIAAGPNPGH